MLPLVLAGISALPDLISLGSKLLDGVDHPTAKAASAALQSVTSAIDSKEIPQADLDAANAHLEAMAQVQQDAYADQATTQRAELASEDKYVRRVRPTFGYAMALSWTLQMLAVTALMFFNPAMAVQVIASLSQLTGLWGLALAVLGVHFYGRSQEKKAQLAQSAPAAIGSIVGTTLETLVNKVAR